MPSRRGRPVGHCSICRHLDRNRAELLLAGGASVASVARKFRLSPDALSRHWRKHVSDARRTALVLGPVEIAALAARVAEESESVLDHHRVIRAGLLQLFDSALDAADLTGGAIVAGKLIQVNDSIAKITGQLATSPLVQHNTVNVFSNDPGFMRFMTELADVLAPFPEARRAVMAKLQQLPDVAPTPAPQLEHHHAEESDE